MSLSSSITLPSDRDASGRSIGAEEMTLLEQVIASGNLFGVGGTMVPALEREFGSLLGVPHARAVSSGSAAVHTALGALDIAPGDEVVTSGITDMGAISPILFQGAVPVFADVDPDTLNVTAETVRERMTSRTRAIIVTHLFGNPCDLDPLMHLAREHGVPIVEDAAQAYLAEYRGRFVGTIGDLGAFSFQQTKHMTCGEGGLVVTGSDDLARRARLWADKGWGYDDPAPDHEFLGLNYRMTELQAAVALAQLRKLSAMTAQRVAMAARLRDALSDLPGIRPVPTTAGATQTYWKFVLLVDRELAGAGPDAIGRELKQLGVWNAPRYIRKPAFLCRQFQERRTFADTQFPYSAYASAPPVEAIADYPGCRDGLARVLVLPWTERHDETHVGYIAEQLRTVAERARRGELATPSAP